MTLNEFMDAYAHVQRRMWCWICIQMYKNRKNVSLDVGFSLSKLHIFILNGKNINQYEQISITTHPKLAESYYQ